MIGPMGFSLCVSRTEILLGVQEMRLDSLELKWLKKIRK